MGWGEAQLVPAQGFLQPPIVTSRGSTLTPTYYMPPKTMGGSTSCASTTRNKIVLTSKVASIPALQKDTRV